MKITLPANQTTTTTFGPTGSTGTITTTLPNGVWWAPAGTTRGHVNPNNDPQYVILNEFSKVFEMLITDITYGILDNFSLYQFWKKDILISEFMILNGGDYRIKNYYLDQSIMNDVLRLVQKYSNALDIYRFKHKNSDGFPAITFIDEGQLKYLFFKHFQKSYEVYEAENGA